MVRTDRDLVGALLDSLDGGILVVDQQRRIIVWNNWLATATGIDEEIALGKALEDIFVADEVAALSSALATTLETRGSRVLTRTLHKCLLPLKARTGHPIIVEASVQFISSGGNGACMAQFHDVTVQTERERVLRIRQEARYDAVVEAAPDPVLTLDANGIIQFANPAATRELGYSRNELLGQPFAVLIGESENWNSAWPGLLSGGGSRRPIEATIRKKAGELVYAEISGSQWVSDAHSFVTVIVRDITERRAAEQYLREMNQTLELLVAQRTAERDRMWRLSSDLMMVTLLDGTIRAVNPAWMRLASGAESDMIGKNIRTAVIVEDLPVLDEALQKLANANAAGPQLFEIGMSLGVDDIRRLSWSAVADDGLLYAVGRDVTEERHKDAALRAAEEQLRQSQKMEAIGQLTGGIAHDFNNLLTGIMGAMNIIQRRIAQGKFNEVQEFIDAAIGSGHRAASLTQRLLAFARRQPLAPEPVDVNELIRGMDDLLLRTLGKPIVMERDAYDGLWPTFCDRNQLENALLNLAINARDAMAKGGVLTISTRNMSIGQTASEVSEIVPGDYTVISVRDTGHGIPEDVLPKVFEPFFTTKPEGKGTGLGLSMVYGFARQSGGNVQIETEAGHGTTVRLFLPRYCADADVPRENRNESTAPPEITASATN